MSPSSIIMKKLHQRPISYYPLYKDITGSLQGAVLLSQLMYWFSDKDKIYKTNDQFRKEINLTDHEMRSAKKAIQKIPFITTTREGLPAKTFYEIDWQIYEEFTKEFITKQVGGISTNCAGGNSRTITESIKTETTTDKNKDKSLLNDADASCEKKGNVVVKKVRKRKSSKIAKPTKIIKPTKIAKPIVPAPDVSDRKVNKKKTTSKAKIAKPGYLYNTTDERNYIMLTNAGCTDHVDKTTKTYFNTMNIIHELFTKDCKSPLLNASNFDYAKDVVWTIDEVVEVFSFHLEIAPKPIRNIGQFIFNPGYGTKSKPFSQLIHWANKLANGDDALSDKAKLLYKNLKKKIEKTNNKHNIESFEKLSIHNLNNAATFIDEVEEEYEFITTEIGVRPKLAMISAFTTFIVKKMIRKGDAWKLGYISTEFTQDDFIYEMKKGNTLTKKRKRGFDPHKKR